MEPIVERIKEIIQAQHMTNSAFAQFIDVKQATLSHTLSGRNKKPSIDLVQAIASKCGVSFNWLMEGTEEYMPNFIRVYRGIIPETIDADSPMNTEEQPLWAQNGLFDSAIDIPEVNDHAVINDNISPSYIPDITVEPTILSQEETQQPTASPEMPVPQVVTKIEYKERPPRKVREICIYYDDGTYEYFVPRK